MQSNQNIYICSVKKGFIYIILLFFILHNTSLDQLLKLPTLVAHYMEHKKLNQDISIVDFLAMHYSGNNLNNNHDDRDWELPYKSIDFQNLVHSYVPLAKACVIKQASYQPVHINYPVFRDQYLPQPALSALFRPPKA